MTLEYPGNDMVFRFQGQIKVRVTVTAKVQQISVGLNSMSAF